MKMLSIGDTVGIVACSNGLDENMKDKISELIDVLKNIGLKVSVSDKIYKKYSHFNGTGKERADALMNFYKDQKIKAIFDVSGGDLSNEILGIGFIGECYLDTNNGVIYFDLESN